MALSFLYFLVGTRQNGVTVCLGLRDNLLGTELLFDLEGFLAFDCFVDLEGSVVLIVFFIPRAPFLFFARPVALRAGDETGISSSSSVSST